MRAAATRHYSERGSTTPYGAFELGNSEWRLAFTPSIDQLPLVCSIAARALASFEAELAGAKAHFGLPTHARHRQ